MRRGDQLRQVAQRILDVGALASDPVPRLGDRRRVGVKPCDAAPDPPDVLRAQGAVRQQRRGGPLLAQAAHLDRVLDCPWSVGRPRHEPAVVVGDNGADAQVGAGRERRVEADLLVGKHTSSLQRAVVQEREPHRLAHLVGQVAREEHPRRVRLAHLHDPRVVRIEARVGHRGRDAVGVGLGPMPGRGCHDRGR